MNATRRHLQSINLLEPVRMNTFISGTIRARTIKFGDTMSNYSTQLKLVVEFDHVFPRLHN